MLSYYCISSAINKKDTEILFVKSDSVVVITSVSHTEGREFEPRSDYFFPQISANTIVSTVKILKIICIL